MDFTATLPDIRAKAKKQTAATLNFIKQIAVPFKKAGEAKRFSEAELYFPQNPFLTKEMVFALCKKFDLSFAPVGFYTETIPNRIGEQILSFRIPEKLQTEKIKVPRNKWLNAAPLILQLKDNPIAAAFHQDCHRHGRTYIDFSFRYAAGDIPQARFLPLTRNILVRRSRESQKDNEVYLYLGNGDYVRFDLSKRILRPHGVHLSLELEADAYYFHSRTLGREIEYRYYLDIEYFVLNDFVRSINSRTEYGLQAAPDMIIAPQSQIRGLFFKRDINGCIEPDLSGEGKILPANDPLYLKRVNGGFIVAAQWDERKEILQEVGYGGGMM